MLPVTEPPDASNATRPTVSELVRGPLGNTFTITFGPEQALPAHRNASRLLLTVRAGRGTLQLEGAAPVGLASGESVQLDPDVPHALVAGPDGMVVDVLLAASCCPDC